MVAVVSAKEWRFLLGASAILVVLLALCAYLVYMPQSSTMLPTTTLTVGDTTLLVELATTPTERELGLSGRQALLPDRGMFFVFDSPGEWGIWMKDMRFSIDILWADTNGVVVAIEHQAIPSSYPHSFSPGKPAQYVLEVPAGFAKAHAIAIGDQIVVK